MTQDRDERPDDEQGEPPATQPGGGGSGQGSGSGGSGGSGG